jgi:preprotein translocase, SecE subunit, bacterial
MKKIKRFYQDVVYEFKQISWLNKKELKMTFITVIISLLFLLCVVVLGNLLGFVVFNELFK